MEVGLGHTILLVRMGDRMATCKHGKQRVGVVLQ
jgi:hypothetical protein